MEKILITGTGRSGTTFLIKLFTFLEYDTGYTKLNYSNHISKNCNSGMERDINQKFYILKSPFFIESIDEIINNKNVIIKQIIIPVRDYTLSAKSRLYHNNQNGGLWNATNEEEQILFYNKIIANYIFYMTKYNINTLFIDFDRMVNDKKYLFNKIKHILDEKNIDFEYFSIVYDEVSEISKPK
jgi:hypothetical protein